MDVSGLVQSLPGGVFLVVELFLGLMAAVLAIAGVHARRRAALIDATRTSPIGFARDGYAELEGTIETAGAALSAPLTGWACVWYRTRVEKYVASSRQTGSAGGWHRVSGATSDAPFVLRDATGACLVRPAGADVTPTDRSVWYGAGPEPDDRNPPRLAPTQSRTPVLEVAGGSSHRYRYSEERIYPGDPLLALGAFTTGRVAGAPTGRATVDDDGDEPDPAAEATGLRASLSRGAGTPFILSTTPQAAHVAMQQFGGETALYMALLPLAAAALLAWIRLG